MLKKHEFSYTYQPSTNKKIKQQNQHHQRHQQHFQREPWSKRLAQRN